MMREAFERTEALPREPDVTDPAGECVHIALRPRWESDGYLCDSCHRELTTVEAEEVSSEASVRCIDARAAGAGIFGGGN